MTWRVSAWAPRKPTRALGCATRIRLERDLDAATCADLDFQITRALACGATEITLDLSAVRHVDTSTLAEVVDRVRRADVALHIVDDGPTDAAPSARGATATMLAS